MATTINSRSQRSNCTIGALIDNGSSLKINVDIEWSYRTTAPESMSANINYYNDAGQGFSDNRSYDSTGSYDTTGKIPCGVFDTTFNDALKALILDCFENYTNVNLIGEE